MFTAFPGRNCLGYESEQCQHFVISLAQIPWIISTIEPALLGGDELFLLSPDLQFCMQKLFLIFRQLLGTL